MKLLQLQYFYEVYQERSISNAAKKLFVAQPTISIAIKELEDDLGVCLFHRERNRLIPTEAGTEIFDRVAVLLKQAESIQRYAEEKRDRIETITISMPPLLATTFLSKFVEIQRKFERDNPCTVIELTETRSRESVEVELLSNIVQMAVAYSYSDNTYPDCARQTLYQMPLALFVNIEHPLAARDTITAEDIEDVPLISIYKDTTAMKQLITRWFRNAGKNPHFLYQFSQNSIVNCLNEDKSLAAIGTYDLIPHVDSIKRIPLEPETKINVVLYKSRKQQSGSLASKLFSIICKEMGEC